MANWAARHKVEAIIADLQTTRSLTSILKEHGIQSNNFFGTLEADPSLRSAYEHAQKARAELIADQIMELADNATDNYKARNQIDARKWLASKLMPHKYGDRLDLNVNQTVDIRIALEAARNRVRQALDMTPQVETVSDNDHYVTLPVSPQDAPVETVELVDGVASENEATEKSAEPISVLSELLD